MRGDAAACYAAGMNGYVTKPVTMASLGEAISRNTSQARGQVASDLA
jgi:CheY-like chemotaxis protein